MSTVAARAAILLAFGAAAAAIGFLPHEADRLSAYVIAGAPIVGFGFLTALALTLAVAARRVRDSPMGRADFVAVMALLAVTAATVQLTPARMRVQADEYQIAGTAIALSQTGKPVVAMSALVTADGSLQPLGQQVDKRGVLLPLLLAPIVALGAGGVESLIAANACIGAFAIVLFFCLMRQGLPPLRAVAATLPLATLPVFVWATRSLGLEVLNLALLAGTALMALLAVRHRDPVALVALAWLAALLPHARYESVVVGAALWGMAALASLRGAGGLPHNAGIAAACFGFVPFAWQRAQAFEHGPGIDTPFDPAYVPAHAVTAVRQWLFETDWLGPGAPLLLASAVAGAWVVAMRAGRRGLADWERTAVVAGSAVVASSVVVLGYVWGDLSEPNTMRLGLPLYTLVVVMACVGLFSIPARAVARWVPALCVVVSAAGLSAAMTDTHYRRLSVGPALNAVSAWRRARLPCRVAWITPYAGHFVIQGETAMAPVRLPGMWPVLREMARRGDIAAVVFLSVGDHDGTPYELNEAPPGFRRLPIVTLPASDITTFRLELLDLPSQPLDPATPCAPGVFPSP